MPDTPPFASAGENVFGLGDLGSHAMPLAVSKCELCTACAGIPPSQCLAVCIDTGTDNIRLQNDPKYVGLRCTRVRGQVKTSMKRGKKHERARTVMKAAGATKPNNSSTDK